MTRKNIYKLISLIDKEIEYRERFEAIDRYNKEGKIHKKQMDFHKCLKRNRWVFGGNRSGKTECGAVECVWLARGIHPYRKNRGDVFIWAISLSRQVQRDVAQAKILHYLKPDWIYDVIMESGSKDYPENGVIDYILINNIFGGLSKIGFKSCDQGREKFQGASLNYIWFDEEPPEEIYKECKMRIIDRCGEVFGTMTPLKGLSWVYNQIYLNESNDEEVWCENMEWSDNPFLNSEEVESLKKIMSSDELQSRCYGKFIAKGGLVYPEFDPEVHIIEPFDLPKKWYDNISIDPGLNNPLSAHWYAVDFDGNVYVIAEHFEAEKDIIYHSNAIKRISNRLGWKSGFGGKIEAIIDSAANQKTLAGIKSVTELFFENGIAVNTKVDKDLYSGINRVKSYFKDANGKPRLFIFKNCINLIRELKGYFWGKNDTPTKKNDHSLDELRYYIMSRPETPKNNLPKSRIEKDKEKLIRQMEIKRNSILFKTKI
ncbi:MAG: terminase family protein [Clostridia bacterium]|nr:terminase family protein [Clostridia bacterium]